MISAENMHEPPAKAASYDRQWRWAFKGLLALVALAPLPLASNRPLPAALLALGAALLLLGWAFAVWRGTVVAIPPTRLRLPLALYGLVCVWIFIQWLPSPLPDPIWAETARSLAVSVTGRISVNPNETLSGLMRLLSYATVFWVSLQLNAKAERAKFSLRAVAFIGALYAIYGIVAFVAGNEWILVYRKWAYEGSLTSTFVNRNSFATFMGLCLLCTSSLFIHRIEPIVGLRRPIRQRLVLLIETLTTGSGAWLAGAVLTQTVALLMTGSRAGVFSTGIGLLVLWFIHARHKSRRGRTTPALAIGAAFLVFALLAGGGSLFDRYADQGAELGKRADVYELTADAIMTAPWTGSGFGTFANVLTAFQARTKNVQPIWDKAHNTYLENALELGIPAAIALNLSILLVALRALKGMRSRKRDWTIPGIGVAATIVVGLHSLVDFSLQIPAVSVLYAFILGLAVAQSWSSRS